MVIIDDVITAGTAVREAIGILTKAGAVGAPLILWVYGSTFDLSKVLCD